MAKTLQLGAAYVHELSGVVLVPSSKYLNKLLDGMGIDKKEVENAPEVQQQMEKRAKAYWRFWQNPQDACEASCLEKSCRTLDRFYVATPLEEPLGEYIFFQCSCPKYVLRSVCKHAVGLGLKQKKFVVPKEKSFACIKRRKKPGAPKKARTAWNFMSDSDDTSGGSDED